MLFSPSTSFISVNGPDKDKFIQSIISNDINKLYVDNILYALILSPQGKFNFEIFLYLDNDKIIIESVNDCLELLKNKLNAYKLRSKVEILEEDKYKTIISQNKIDFLCGGLDPRSVNSNIFRYITKNDDNFYNDWIFANVVPSFNKELKVDKTFPLEVGLDKLNAIDFNKGCFVGQEVVARTKHRGVVRKSLYRFVSVDNLEVGDIIMNENNEEMGVVTSKYNNQYMVFCRIELIEQSKKIIVNNNEISVVDLFRL